MVPAELGMIILLDYDPIQTNIILSYKLYGTVRRLHPAAKRIHPPGQHTNNRAEGSIIKGQNQRKINRAANEGQRD